MTVSRGGLEWGGSGTIELGLWLARTLGVQLAGALALLQPPPRLSVEGLGKWGLIQSSEHLPSQRRIDEKWQSCEKSPSVGTTQPGTSS